MFKYSVYACFAGFLLDLIIGDPSFAFHPIRLIGSLISGLERLLRKINNKRLAGLLLVVLTIGISTGLSFGLLYLAYKINAFLGLFAESILCSFMLAAKSLKKESMRVYDRLCADDTEGARAAVSMIVGRDTASLDRAGITRAAVETVAENLSDGVIAPMLYMLLGGGAAAVCYKAVNTMDSMVGYKDEKYREFGFFAAKLDDIVNFIPARLSAVMMVISAFLLRLDGKNAVRIFTRDRLRHASPNSAQTESVCAGALDVRLAGDAYYFGKLCKKPFIGDDIRAIEAEDIVRANRLMYLSAVLSAVIFGALRLLGGVLPW